MGEHINPHEKDRLFCFIYGREENRKWTLSLYNAINGSSYSDPDAVEITTMEDVIYMGMKNDVSFIINSEISLYEHQSSYNPNMPVRQLMYLGRQYDKYIKKTKQNVYGNKQLILPLPRLVTFYNGKQDEPDQILKLSDSFFAGSDINQADVSVQVHMYNIRPQYRNHLLDDCKTLAEYSWFIEEIRKNQEMMETTPAVDKAIKDMPDDFEIKEFLREHQSEVKNMCITEYDEKETMELFKEEFLADGELKCLISLICRKLRKGKTIPQIADEVEQKEEHVQRICDAISEFAPEYDEAIVFEAFLKTLRQREYYDIF